MLLQRQNIPIWFLYITIFIHQILTALTFPIAKIGLNEFDSLIYAFFRFLIATVSYLPILIYLEFRNRMPPKDHLRLFIIGLILIPFNQVLFLVGQSLTSAGHAALLFATVPIFIYILAIIFLGERPSTRRTVGILIAAVGVYYILAGGKARFGMEYLLGDIIVLVAVIAWAAATVLMKPLAMKYGAFRVTGLALSYGSFVYFPYGIYRAVTGEYGGITTAGWLSVLYLALVVSVLCYFLWYWILKYMEASRAAVFQNIQPVIASAVAAVMLSEPIGTNFILGGIIVIFGVILTEIKNGPKHFI